MFKTLKADIIAFKLAIEIVQITTSFPKKTWYALIAQAGRRLRCLCLSIAEAYGIGLYQKYDLNKLSNANMENSTTQVWLNFALPCLYILKEQKNTLCKESEPIGKLVGYMIKNPKKFSLS